MPMNPVSPDYGISSWFDHLYKDGLRDLLIMMVVVLVYIVTSFFFSQFGPILIS